jgi:flavin reductase (DIM6/NTAB) family NADH-FMN oxidoreductase RutF
MNKCAAPLPYGESELKFAGLTTAPSSVVKPPRIAESPASLECVEHSTLQIGENRIVLGLIQRVHARDGLIDPAALRVNHQALRTIGRMAVPDWYCRTTDRFAMRPPNIENPKTAK